MYMFFCGNHIAWPVCYQTKQQADAAFNFESHKLHHVDNIRKVVGIEPATYVRWINEHPHALLLDIEQYLRRKGCRFVTV